jgi:hypothetical protein
MREPLSKSLDKTLDEMKLGGAALIVDFAWLIENLILEDLSLFWHPENNTHKYRPANWNTGN